MFWGGSPPQSWPPRQSHCSLREVFEHRKREANSAEILVGPVDLQPVDWTTLMRMWSCFGSEISRASAYERIDLPRAGISRTPVELRPRIADVRSR
jgi:hypothetical protein